MDQCVFRSYITMGILVLVMADLTVSILAIGYNGQLKDGYDLGKVATLFQSSYSLRDSFLDFVLVAFIRVSLLFGGLIGILSNSADGLRRAKSVLLAVFCLFMLLLAFSFVKLLAFTEDSVNFKNFGFWILFTWNIVANFTAFLTWKFVFCGIMNRMMVIHNSDMEPIGNGSGEIETERERKDKDNDEKKPKFNRKTFAQMWRLLKYCKSEWKWYFFGFVFLFIYSTARIFIPYYTGQVIANIVVSHSYSQLLHCVFIMAGLSAVSTISGGLRGGCFTYGNAKVILAMRTDLFRSLIEQEIGFYDSTKTGEITSRLTTDCQTVADTVSLNVNVFLRNVVMMFGSLIFMLMLSWRLTMVTFIAMPTIVLISKVYGQYYDRLSEETQTSLARANEVAEEVLSSMRTVRSFAAESEEDGRYRNFLVDTLAIMRKKAYAYVGYLWSSDLFENAMLISVLWFGGHLVLSNMMDSHSLISFLLYQIQLGENLYMMGAVWTGLMESVGGSRKVFEYIDRSPRVKNDGKFTSDNLVGKIEFKNVCFSYPTRPDTQVLNNMAFTVNPGETVALVGPSGGGKSSCVCLLEHFYEPTSGSILLDGVSVGDYAHKLLHAKIALVGQEPVLFARSVRMNIGYGLELVTDEQVRKAAILANAHGFIVDSKEGYETDAGEKGVQLSGGQKQRVAIARALIRSPVVLILDEATSALDAESEHLVQEAIFSNLANRTVLLIAHRLSTVEKADRIVVINKGRVEQTGSHRELIFQDGLYRNLVQRQLLGNSTFDETPSSIPTVPTCSKLTESIEVKIGQSPDKISSLLGSICDRNSPEK